MTTAQIAAIIKNRVLEMLRGGKPPEYYYGLIQPADVLLVHGFGSNPADNFIGDGIIRFTGGVYSHSALVMASGRNGSMTEAELEGVISAPLKKYFEPKPGQSYRLCIRRLIGIDNPTALKVIADGKKRIGWHYDLAGLAAFAGFLGYAGACDWKGAVEKYRERFERDSNRSHLVICSEHCGLAFFNAGHPLRDDIREAKDNSCLSPDGKVSIARSSKMSTVAEWIVKG